MQARTLGNFIDQEPTKLFGFPIFKNLVYCLFISKFFSRLELSLVFDPKLDAEITNNDDTEKGGKMQRLPDPPI